MNALEAAQYDPASPEYHHWLARGQFDQEFGPSAADVAAVTSWLRSVGLHPGSLSGAFIPVSASALAASRAFGTPLENYRTAAGVRGFAAQGAPLVPATLTSGVTAILGLQTLTRRMPQLEVGPATRAPGSASSPALTPNVTCSGDSGEGFFTLPELGADYGINDELSDQLTGGGQTVAVYELASHAPSDVTNYEGCLGLSNPVTTVDVDGGGGATGGTGTEEANLDIEQVAAQSPGSSIVSYEGPNDGTGPDDVWHTIVGADTAQVISTSWGECEDGTGQSEIDTEHAIFVQAAMQGQSVLAASGDAGSEDCLGCRCRRPVPSRSTTRRPTPW